MVKGYHWLCPAILGREEDADFLGRSQFLWLVNSLPLIHCRACMEKHIQAWWFGWASLIFPYQQKWNNTLGKWGDNAAVHFADDRLCVPSGHHHLSLSPIPVGWIFFLSYWVTLTATNTISSEIPLFQVRFLHRSYGDSLEKLKMRSGLFSKPKSLPFHSCHQFQVATASCPLLVLSLHSNPLQQMTLSFLGWIYFCLKLHLQGLLDTSSKPYSCCPKVNK